MSADPFPPAATGQAESAAAPAWTLRRAAPGDAASMARLMADPSVFANLLQVPYASEERWRSLLAEQAQPGKPDLHLVADVGGEVVGSAGLFPVGTSMRRRHAMGLGISVATAWRGRGVAPALMKALCDFADDWAGLLRLELTVFADNLRAQALYRRFGFVEEGRLRAYGLREGQFVDALAMARLHPNQPKVSVIR